MKYPHEIIEFTDQDGDTVRVIQLSSSVNSSLIVEVERLDSMGQPAWTTLSTATYNTIIRKALILVNQRELGDS